jgi:hypothetical protein
MSKFLRFLVIANTLAEADPEGRQGRELERFAVEEVQQP